MLFFGMCVSMQQAWNDEEKLLDFIKYADKGKQYVYITVLIQDYF